MIALIVAYDKNRLIGNKGIMPWYIPEEMQRFKELTTNNAVLMGRMTYEGLSNKPLPDRLNLVLSKYKKKDSESLKYVSSLEEAIRITEEHKIDLFVSGGASVYKAALPYCEKLFISEIELEYEGDTYFPEIDKSLYDIELDYVSKGETPFKSYIYTKK